MITIILAIVVSMEEEKEEEETVIIPLTLVWPANVPVNCYAINWPTGF